MFMGSIINAGVLIAFLSVAEQISHTLLDLSLSLLLSLDVTRCEYFE